jgi:ketol-acid reductoisomerase
MEEVLEEVQDGTFARQWILENQAGRPNYEQRKSAEKDHDIEAVGEELRNLYSW